MNTITWIYHKIELEHITNNKTKKYLNIEIQASIEIVKSWTRSWSLKMTGFADPQMVNILLVDRIIIIDDRRCRENLDPRKHILIRAIPVVEGTTNHVRSIIFAMAYNSITQLHENQIKSMYIILDCSNLSLMREYDRIKIKCIVLYVFSFSQT